MGDKPEPKIARFYAFRRQGDGRSEEALFLRFADGGAVVLSAGKNTLWKHWKLAIDDLGSQGYEQCYP